MLLLRYAHIDVWNVIESRNQFGDKKNAFLGSSIHMQENGV